MQSVLYLEINVICIVILLIETLQTNFSIDKSYGRRLFTCCLISFMGAFLFDAVRFQLLNVSNHNFAIIFDYLYYLALMFATFMWFAYFETTQNSKLSKHRKLVYAHIIPAIIICLLILVDFLFNFGDSELIYNTIFRLVYEFIVFAYFFVPSFKALIRAFDKTNYADKRRLIIIASCAAFPIILGILQIAFYPTTPLLCAGVALSVIMYYQMTQFELITKDSLTDINNRNQLLRFLAKNWKPAPPEELYLIMMDADKFKRINDVYGHVEGDKALILIAKALKKAVPKKFIIARYGGDEFIVCGLACDDQIIQDIIDKIYTEIALLNKSNDAKWKVKLSISCAKKTKNVLSIPELIKIADKRLYEIKERKRSQLDY